MPADRLLLAALGAAALLALEPCPRALADDQPDAEILLRKSFAPPSGARRPAGPPAAPATAAARGAAAAAPAAPARPAATGPERLVTAAEALGRSVWSSGTLGLPGVTGPGATIDTARTPVVDLGDGASLILDPSGTLAGDAGRAIEARWPAYRVRQVAPGAAGLRDALGEILGAAGRASVERGSSVAFGTDVTVRLRPDFVVLHGEDAPPEGETGAVSVVDAPRDAFPPELRELAREHRILVLELLDNGAEAGPRGNPWRDPAAPVTTVLARDPRLPIAELAERLGLAVERDVAVALPPGAPPASADLRISRAGTSTLVFVRPPDPAAARLLAERGEDVVVAPGAADLAPAVARILERFGVPSLGPGVEFYRPTPAAPEGRFVVTVPGRLAELGARRLLVTQAELPEQLRLFLTRAGIEIFTTTIR